jgi:predicted enzyme related to lactoylglutathione lyase
MSSTEAPKEPAKAAATEFENVTPILRVGNIAASIDYYVSVLGFKLDWQQGLFASISRDRCRVFLCEGDQGNPGSWVWIGIGDLEALFEECKSRGAKVRHPPTNYSWAYEMQIEDLDGNLSSAWAPTQSRASPSVNGSICTAICGPSPPTAARPAPVESVLPARP